MGRKKSSNCRPRKKSRMSVEKLTQLQQELGSSQQGLQLKNNIQNDIECQFSQGYKLISLDSALKILCQGRPSKNLVMTKIQSKGKKRLRNIETAGPMFRNRPGPMFRNRPGSISERRQSYSSALQQIMALNKICKTQAQMKVKSEKAIDLSSPRITGQKCLLSTVADNLADYNLSIPSKQQKGDLFSQEKCGSERKVIQSKIKASSKECFQYKHAALCLFYDEAQGKQPELHMLMISLLIQAQQIINSIPQMRFRTKQLYKETKKITWPSCLRQVQEYDRHQAEILVMGKSAILIYDKIKVKRK